MEVCGGQTHTLLRSGIDWLLPAGLRARARAGLSCVRDAARADRPRACHRRPAGRHLHLGDMIRAPGSTTDLQQQRAGADVRIVYAPPRRGRDRARDARPPGRLLRGRLRGRRHPRPRSPPGRRAGSVSKTSRRWSRTCLVPPAIEAILTAPENRVQAFLAAGHVCTVMGYEEYEAVAARHRVPIVVTGFEPVDLLEGISMVVRQLESGRHGVENQYVRSVRRSGNREAQAVIARVYEVCDCAWRGLGVILVVLASPERGVPRPRRRAALRRRRGDRDRSGGVPQRRGPAGAPPPGRGGLRRSGACQSAAGAPMVSSEGLRRLLGGGKESRHDRDHVSDAARGG
ncbi:MAG: hydrogenase formation protein HypD [Candidatus Binatia bacterium]